MLTCIHVGDSVKNLMFTLASYGLAKVCGDLELHAVRAYIYA